MKKKLFLLFFTISALCCRAQQKEVDLKFWNSNPEKPIVFYLSGDGGFNNFSTNFCNLISKAGYTVVGLDAKAFFWKKKSPLEMGKLISEKLKNILSQHLHPKLYIVGYSFGADAAPFLVNQLASIVKQYVQNVVLIEPSRSTDLEIHVFDMLGRQNTQGAYDVVNEINRMGTIRGGIILGTDKSEFPVKKITAKNMEIIAMKGGHHFDGNLALLVKTTLALF